MECLDGADASQLTPKRTESVTAPQALALLEQRVRAGSREGDGFQAGEASRRSREADRDRAAALVWGRRRPTTKPKLFAAYAAKHGLPNLCRVLFNTNEFLFAD